MTAETLIAEFRALGVELIPDPERDKIKIRPAGVVPPELKEKLRERKAEVLAALTSPATVEPEAPPVPSPWPESLPGLGHRRVIAFAECQDCQDDPSPDDVLKVGVHEIAVPGQRGTWIAYGRVSLCPRHARARAGGAA